MTSTHPRMLARGLALTVLAGLTTTLTAPAGAAPADEPRQAQAPERASTAAGSIVYISNYNVWIARGDGSGARALTTDGSFAAPYGAPTQSDGGVVVATHSERLVRMNQSGRVLNVLDPAPLPTTVGVSIDGTPVDAAISPDGTRIAYTFTQYLTPAGASSGFRSATGYTSADQLTDPAPLRTTEFWSPSWVGNSRTLQTGGYGSHVMIHDLGTEPQKWFSDDELNLPSEDVGNAQLSRDGQFLVAVRGYQETATIYWYAVNGTATSGAPPADPTPLCQIALAGITNPTWGPDSDSLAWQEPDGIYSRSGARDCTAPSARILPGGSEPHWSPAVLGAPEVVPAPLVNEKRPVIRGKAKIGNKLKASTGTWSVSDLAFTYKWFRNGKKIAGKAGKKKVHKVVRADRGKRLTVTVTAGREGYGSRTATSRAVRVKK